MKTYLIGPYGPLPNENWADYRFTNLGKKLSANKRKVEWVTSSFSHHTKKQRNIKNGSIKINDYFYIKLIKTPSYQNNFGIKRLWFEFFFGVSAAFYLLKKKDIKFTITAGTNFTIHPFISFICLLKNKPYAIDVLDLYPEHILKNTKLVLRLLLNILLMPLYALRKLEIIGSAKMIYCSKNYMQHLVSNQNKKHKVVFIGTSIDKNIPKQIDLPIKKSCENWIVYAGSLGETYDMDVLKDVILKFSGNNKIRFFIAGKGPHEETFRKLEQKNFHFLGDLIPSELLYLYSKSDLLLATYSKTSTVSIPLKAFDSISQNLPIISSLEQGDLFDLIQNKKIGFTYEGGNVASLVKVLNDFINNENLILEAKQNIEKIKLEYSLENQYDEYLKHIIE